VIRHCCPIERNNEGWNGLSVTTSGTGRTGLLAYSGTNDVNGNIIGLVGSNTDQQWISFAIQPSAITDAQSNVIAAWGLSSGAHYVLCVETSGGTNWIFSVRYWNGSSYSGSLGSYNFGAVSTWIWLNWERTNSTGAQKVYLDDTQRISFTHTTTPVPSMENFYWKKDVTNAKWVYTAKYYIDDFLWNNTETPAEAWTDALSDSLEFGLNNIESVSSTDHSYVMCFQWAVIGPSADTSLNVRPSSAYTVPQLLPNADSASPYNDFTGYADTTNKYNNVDGDVVNYNYATAANQSQMHGFAASSPGAGNAVLAVAGMWRGDQNNGNQLWDGNNFLRTATGRSVESLAMTTAGSYPNMVENPGSNYHGLWVMQQPPALAPASTFVPRVMVY